MLFGDRIERRRRLVENEDRRVGQERAGDDDELVSVRGAAASISSSVASSRP